MTRVVDASVAVKWFFEEPGHKDARALLDRPEILAAPSLVLAEVGNAAWKRFRNGAIDRAEADGVVRLAGRPFSELVATDALFPAAARLMLDLDHPIYDCFYLALAARADAPLVTADRRQAMLAERVGVKVDLIG